MAKNGVAVFGFAEKNFAWNPARTKIVLNRAKAAMLQSSCRRVNISMQTSACTGWIGGKYQPGGICTTAIDKGSSRVVGKEEDPNNLGRWSALMLRIKGTVMVIITA